MGVFSVLCSAVFSYALRFSASVVKLGQFLNSWLISTSASNPNVCSLISMSLNQRISSLVWWHCFPIRFVFRNILICDDHQILVSQVPVRTTSRSPVLSRRESPLPSQPSNQGGQRNAGRWVKRPQACLTLGLCGCGLRELLTWTLLKVVKAKTVTPPLHRGTSQNREFQKIW